MDTKVKESYNKLSDSQIFLKMFSSINKVRLKEPLWPFYYEDYKLKEQ